MAVANWLVIGVAISTDIWRLVGVGLLSADTAQLRESWTCRVLVFYVQVPAPNSGVF